MLEFGALRSLFNQPASSETWEEICEQLTRLEQSLEAFNDVLRPYCEVQLRGWPSEVSRALPAPLHETLWGEVPHPALTLTDQLAMYHIAGEALERARQNIARLGPLPMLRALTMTYCALDDAQLEGWVEVLAGTGLRSWTLHNNPLTTLSALIESPLAGQLRELDLFDSRLEDQHAAALVRAASMAGLERLELMGAGVGPMTAQAFGEAGALPALQGLGLGDGELEDEQVEALLGLERPALKWLSLNCNQLTDLTLERLSREKGLTGLSSLYLWFNQFGDAGMGMLLRSWRMAQLEELHVGSNPVTPSVFAAQLEAARAPRLKTLAIDGLELTGDHIAQIVRGDFLSQVEHLTLNHNPIGDQGAQALASALGLTKLRSLAVQSCGIGPAGVEALMRAPWAAQLERLELSMNPIEDRGARAIAQGPCARLATLFLGMCEMTRAGHDALAGSEVLPASLRRQHQRA